VAGTDGTDYKLMMFSPVSVVSVIVSLSMYLLIIYIYYRIVQEVQKKIVKLG